MVPKTRHSTNFNDFCNNNNLKTGQRLSCVAFCVVAVQPLNVNTIQKPDQNINTFPMVSISFLIHPTPQPLIEIHPTPWHPDTTENALQGSVARQLFTTTYHLAAVALSDSQAAHFNPTFRTPVTFSRYISRMAMAPFRPLPTSQTSSVASKKDAAFDA